MRRHPEFRTGVWPEVALPLFEQHLAELAATFVGLRADEMDAHIEQAIGRVAEFFGLDRATVGQRPPDGGALRITHQWVRARWPRLEQWIPDETAPWVTARLARGERVVFSRPEDLPAEARRDREFFQRIGTRSNVTLPLTVAGSVVGWLAFAGLRQEHTWPSRVLEQLELVARILGEAIARKQAELTLRRALEFERLLAGLSATFVHLPLNAMDRHIEQAIGQVGEFLGVDRVNVYQYRDGPADRLLSRTHHWVRDGVPPAALVQDGSMPWLKARVLGGREVIALNSLDDLPPEAARDRVSLAQLGVLSLALAPMVVEDRFLGVLGLGSVLARASVVTGARLAPRARRRDRGERPRPPGGRRPIAPRPRRERAPARPARGRERLPAGGGPRGPRLRGHRRPERARPRHPHEGRAGRRHRRPRPPGRRDRHRQGAPRPRDPCPQPPQPRPPHRRQLRRPARHPHRERALRPREGRLHRRHPGQARSVRAGRRRHPVPRRDRRPGARPPDEAPPRPPGRRVPAPRVHRDPEG